MLADSYKGHKMVVCLGRLKMQDQNMLTTLVSSQEGICSIMTPENGNSSHFWYAT